MENLQGEAEVNSTVSRLGIRLLLPFFMMLIANVGFSQSIDKVQHSKRLTELRSALSAKDLSLAFHASEENLSVIDEKAKNLRDLDLESSGGAAGVWPKSWQKISLESAKVISDLESLKILVHKDLESLRSNDTSSAKNVLYQLDADIQSQIEKRSKSWIYSPRLNMSLSPIDSARFIAGTLFLDRLENLVRQQMEKIEFPEMDFLAPPVIAATEWIDYIKEVDPGLMTTGDLFDAYCVESILETYPLSHRPPMPNDSSQSSPSMSGGINFPLPHRRNPMDKLSGICELRRFALQSKRDSNPWLQFTRKKGDSTLDLGIGKKIDCNTINGNFKSYIRGYENSTGILQKMIIILDDYVANRIDDTRFHSTYDPLEKTYAELQEQLTQLYPDENFQRIHTLQLNWKDIEKPSSDARFVPWIVDYGPNSWNGTWSRGLNSQDWHVSGPIFDSAEGLTYSVKASIHDVCVDHRTVWIFGFWADDTCSSEPCLFLKPGLSISAL